MGAQFTPIWSESTTAGEDLPHFAGVLLDLVSKNGSASDFSGQPVGSFFARSSLTTTATELAIVIGDGHTSYGAKVRQALSNTATKYTFSLNETDMELTDFPDGETAHSYSDVLANVKFFGFTAFRTTASTVGSPGDVETIYLDELAVPEPASAVILLAAAAGLAVIRPRR